ncbi:MAG: hypothetical protein SGJ20_13290 [Planctomycetota bacterium]|nr:hypothetical protein [Planctomycetota bacterium]
MSPMRLLVCGGLVFASTTGCNQQYFRTPRLCNPGSAQQQQLNATQFDPYPEDALGPAVDGGRPPGYMTPRSQPAIYRGYINSQ